MDASTHVSRPVKFAVFEMLSSIKCRRNPRRKMYQACDFGRTIIAGWTAMKKKGNFIS